MTERYKIAVVGSGPGGLSAAARAAERGLPHILLEAEPHLSNTIYRYQKGKHVMDEPGILPLRSPLPFKAGSREDILGAWDQGWFHAKLALVIALSGYHGYLGGYARKLARGERPLTGKQLRLLNEVPGVAVALIVILVVVKPF